MPASTTHDNTRYDHTIDASWLDVFAPLRDHLADVEARAGLDVVPPPHLVYRAYRMPATQVRVILLGQDPYPTPGHAIGLSFAANKGTRPIPRSIANMYKELHDDLGIEPAQHADLSAWADQGVLLLNTSLTTLPGQANAHQSIGWAELTRTTLHHLAERHTEGQPLVALLLGSKAHAYDEIFVNHNVPIVSAPHPSPLSAHRGFFGSKVFSRVNTELTAQGADPINWRIPE